MKKVHYIVSIFFVILFLSVPLSTETIVDSSSPFHELQKEFCYTQASVPISPLDKTNPGWKINPEQTAFALKQNRPFSLFLNLILTGYFPIQNDFPFIIHLLSYFILGLPPPAALLA